MLQRRPPQLPERPYSQMRKHVVKSHNRFRSFILIPGVAIGIAALVSQVLAIPTAWIYWWTILLIWGVSAGAMLILVLGVEALDLSESAPRLLASAIKFLQSSEYSARVIQTIDQRAAIAIDASQTRASFPLLVLPITIPLLTYVGRWDVPFALLAILIAELFALVYLSELNEANDAAIIRDAIAEYFGEVDALPPA